MSDSSSDARPVVVVTGAAGALGQAVATHLAASGSRLALFDRDADRLRARLGPIAAHALLLSVDVTDAASVAAAIGRVVATYGRVDAVVHVAGGFEMGEPVHELSRGSWDRMMDLNAWSFVNLSQAVIPVMKRQRSGHVVAVSAAGAREGTALKGAYSAAKSALQRLVESLSHEVREDGIQVNSVAPTTLDTPANRQAMPDADRSSWVTLESAAQAIAFLATPGGQAVHGQHLQLG